MNIMPEPLLFYISFCFAIGLIVCKFTVAFLLYKIFQKSKENELVLGASLLFLFSGISRIIWVIFDYVLTVFDSTYYSKYLLIYKVGFFFNFIGYSCLIFISEKVILKKKSKYLMSVFYNTVLFIALIPNDISLVQSISIIPNIFAMLYIPLSYLYLARYGGVRKRALSIFAGYFIFLLIGSAILAENIVQFYISLNPGYSLEIRSMIHIISVCFKILGMLLIVYGYQRKME